MKKIYGLFIFTIILITQISAQENNNNKFLGGGYVGLGYAVLSGNISEYINNPFILPLTGDIVYKNFVGQLNLDAGYSKVSKTMNFDDGTSWNEGDDAWHNAIGVNIGYSVYNNSSVRITPLIGYAYSFISKKWWGNSEIIDNEPDYHLGNIGVLFDLKNVFHPNKSKEKDGSEYFGLRFSAGVYLPLSDADVYANFYNGTTIYFSVGVVNLSIL